MEDTFIPATDLAASLKVHPNTLYRWAKEGNGPERIHVEGRVGYRLSDIQAWKEATRMKPRKETP